MQEVVLLLLVKEETRKQDDDNTPAAIGEIDIDAKLAVLRNDVIITTMNKNLIVASSFMDKSLDVELN